MLKIQASCFFLLGSDRERQSLHRDLLRRIQHKSAPSAALPAAARPGGDRWRIVPAFLHRDSAGAETAALPAAFSLWGKGLARGRADAVRSAGPARRGGRGRELLCGCGVFASDSASQLASFPTAVPELRVLLPPRWQAAEGPPGPTPLGFRDAEALGATSTGAPNANLRGCGTPPSQHRRFYFFPKGGRVSLRGRRLPREGCAGFWSCHPQRVGGSGCHKGTTAWPGHLTSRKPPPRPLFLGAVTLV